MNVVERVTDSNSALDINNQEAWLVYLADAKLNNELHLFEEFKKYY